jgi:hypothetical protein
MTIPPLALNERHFNDPISAPRRVTTVEGVVTGAPNVISKGCVGHESNEA